MYDTYGIRPEDFRNQWPHQHKALLTITAELQNQTKQLHECSLASSKLVIYQINEACTQLTSEVDRLLGTVREEHAAMLGEFRAVAAETLSDLNNRLKLHAESEARLEQRITRFQNKAHALEESRRNFMALPWWTRAWRALTCEFI